MSLMLLGPTQTGVLQMASDPRAQEPATRWTIQVRPADWTDGLLWPRSRQLGSDASGNLLGADAESTGRWGIDAFDEGGGQQQKKIIGTTKDASGNTLAQCVVQGFVTLNDQFVGQMTSDNGGYFEFCTPYTGQHYLVAYKAGAPDVAGTTVNTLLPV